jgi:integrase
MLIGCGLRRGELLALRVDAIQIRYPGCRQKFRDAVNDRMGIEPGANQ